MLSIVHVISFLSFTFPLFSILLNVVPSGTTSFTSILSVASSPKLLTFIVYLILSPAVAVPSGNSSAVCLIISAVFS